MVAVSTTMVRQVAMSAIRGATTFVITCCYVIQKGFQNYRHNSFANRPIRKNQQESSTRGRSLTNVFPVDASLPVDCHAFAASL